MSNPTKSILWKREFGNFILGNLRAYSVIGFGTKKRSRNVKIESMLDPNGKPVYASYRPVEITCPPDCALMKKDGGDGGGCYAQQGNVNRQQLRAANETFDPVQWVLGLPIGSLVRWNVSGDVVGPDGAEYREAIKVAAELRPDIKSWSYTHAWADPSIRSWADSLPENVRIVASLDDPDHEDRARAMGWKTIATVIPTADGKGFTDPEARATRSAGGLACPAQRVDIGCADCLACMRDGSIVFAVHGPASRSAGRSLAARRSLPTL